MNEGIIFSHDPSRTCLSCVTKNSKVDTNHMPPLPFFGNYVSNFVPCVMALTPLVNNMLSNDSHCEKMKETDATHLASGVISLHGN